jgi:phosphoglycerol transferase MdoB-like AlkP superfamily enzyme
MSVVICVLCVRGGLQVKPLSPTHAFADQDENLGQLSLNSCFTILKSLDQKKLKRVSIFKTDKEAREIVLARQVTREKKEFGDFKGSNVLIILVESLSLEYTGALGGKSYTPFFNELSKKSLSFKRAFAGGKRSIDAIPTIFAGLPSISDAPFISSPYQSMRTLGLANIFRDKGYSSSFFHGGHNGTMYFDTMAQRFGFERYLGMDEYPNKEHYDGKWGIFDHHFLKFCADSMNEQKKPFFNTIFTLSSHNPYTIPKGFEDRFPKGELEIHESIGYADKALEIFFQYAKKQDWYNNTLFIITADHTQKARKKEFSYKIQDYRVPLIYFHPKKSLPRGRQDIITSQSAIGSSLIDLFNFKAKWTFFGPSAFQGDTDKAYAFLRKANDFYLVREENFYTLNRNMKFSQEPSPWSVSPKVDEQRESNKVFLEALYQISNNAIMGRKNDMIEVSF